MCRCYVVRYPPVPDSENSNATKTFYLELQDLASEGFGMRYEPDELGRLHVPGEGCEVERRRAVGVVFRHRTPRCFPPCERLSLIEELLSPRFQWKFHHGNLGV